MLLDRAERCWRAAGVGLFLAVIGVGGTFLALTVFPLIVLAVRDPVRRQRWCQAVIRHSFRLYCAAIQGMRVADIEIEGADRLRGLKGTMVVANHPSLLDVVMIMSVLPNAQCVVKGALWRHPFFRCTVRGANYIPNDLPPDRLMEACIDTLKAGNNLIVFPEGTRTVRGQWRPFKRGFANIATMAGADIQLITIECDPPLLHKGNPWWQVGGRRSLFHLRVGERLDIRDYLHYRYRTVGARKLVQFIQDYYRGVLGDGLVESGVEEADRLGVEAGGLVA